MKINLMAPVGYTGYGVAGYEIYKALYNQQDDVALIPYGSSGRPESDVELLKKGANKLFHHDAPCVNIWHQFDLGKSVGKGKYIGFPFFELNRFNAQELHHLAYPDALAVSSEWAKDVIHHNKIQTPTHVVPLGVDTSLFRPVNSPINRNYTFLNVGKWEVRKGHDILVDAFNKAFSPTDNVELWLMPHNQFLSQEQTAEWTNLYMNSPMGRARKIKLLPWAPTQYDVVRVMQAADCGVFPSRAEGWNLELLEMMACGKPVISTAYSAHTEFCTAQNCSLIEIDEVEPAADGKWFFGQGDWAKIGDKQMLQLIHFMQQEFECGPRANPVGVSTAQAFTWDNSAKKLKEAINET